MEKSILFDENVTMKKYTSSEAAKLLRKMNEEYAALKNLEDRCSYYDITSEEKLKMLNQNMILLRCRTSS